MRYAVEVDERDATELLAPRQEEESREDHQARIDDARGKSLFLLTILDVSTDAVLQVNEQTERVATQRLASPYFRTDSEQSRWSVLSQTLKKAKKEIIDRERRKPPRLSILG